MSQRSKALEQKHKSYEPKAEYDPVFPSGEQARSDRGSYIQYLKDSPYINSSPTKRQWQFHFFKNKNIKWWAARAEWDKEIRTIILPEAIDDILIWKIISKDEAESLRRMIVSPDEENLYVAMSIIIEHKSTVRKLWKLNRHKMPTKQEKEVGKDE